MLTAAVDYVLEACAIALGSVAVLLMASTLGFTMYYNLARPQEDIGAWADYSPPAAKQDDSTPAATGPQDAELLEEFGYRTIRLTSAVLVVPREPRGKRCILSLPGFGRYFSCMDLRERFLAAGFDLCGLDLRRYGRHYAATGFDKPGNEYNYIVNLRDYHLDIDDALASLKSSFDEVVLMGNSTAGLTLSEYILREGDASANASLAKVSGLILTSPLLALNAGLIPPPAHDIVAMAGRLWPKFIVATDPQHGPVVA
eukprot:TRINITY_DN24529_c1_g1_i2.p1 TRINITY_DN24529_c1_g1~~TRINITY_DN24529_c1_g1_i2.p1  ORF type:complete len:257 (-),score=31.54 TRINITY_DN24529_c1_g1_i2:131-901(-)